MDPGEIPENEPVENPADTEQMQDDENNDTEADRAIDVGAAEHPEGDQNDTASRLAALLNTIAEDTQIAITNMYPAVEKITIDAENVSAEIKRATAAANERQGHLVEKIEEVLDKAKQVLGLF